MHCNVGGVDRAVRIILGLIVVGLGVYFKSWLGAIGLVLIFTGIVGFCPLYPLLKINTCKTKTPQKTA